MEQSVATPVSTPGRTIDVSDEGFVPEGVQDELAQMDDSLRCSWCPKGPFKNRAGLGAHMARIHGVKLTGEVANKPSRTTRKGASPSVSLVIRDGELELDIGLHMSERDLRGLLKEHSEELIDSLVG